jgi:NAD(P)-dependent dehydrogenase (short-subunit alcohol dehydrogenase family)
LRRGLAGLFALGAITVMERVFLTGASAGIGRATALALLAAGHEVWGTSRRIERLPQADRFHPVVLDLGDNASVERAFAQACAEAGRIGVVINNAGSGHFGPAELLSEKEIRHQFQVVVFSHIRLMQLAIAHLREKGGGTIINVTSLASRLPVPFMAAYNAAKAAMAAFTMSVQLELSDSTIKIIDLQPADILTDFNDAVTVADHGPIYREKALTTWNIVDQNMKAAPSPEKVAREIVRLVEAPGNTARITVGGWFQAQVAPIIFRFLPQRVRLWGLRQYYKLP